MNRQRIVLLAAACIGAATPMLPWEQLGVLSMPLTGDADLATLLAGGFLLAAVLAMIGDRAKPLRSSRALAAGMMLVGLGLVAFVGVIGSLLPQQLEWGVGVYVAWGSAGLLALGAWADFG